MPARGVERWLTQRLSHRLGVGGRGGDGVCAGVRFLSPHSLVALLLGKERDDPWDPDRLVWPLLDVIDDIARRGRGAARWPRTSGTASTGEDGELRRNRRYSVARRLAGLFASYAVQRPTLVTDWREGRDTDGAGRPPRRRPARGSPSCGDGCCDASTRRRRTCGTRRRWRGCARAATGWTCRRGCRCSGTPGCRSPRSSCSARSASCATCTSGCRRSPRAVGRRSASCRRTGAGAAGGGPVDPAGRAPAARRRWGATRASCGARSARCRRLGSEAARSLARPTSRPSLLGLAAGTTCAPTPSRTRRRARPGARPRTTGRCRCTPATARPARSTCCARCWSGCSRTTRRSSRATSW